MITSLPLADPRDFLWAGGVEDTFVPQTRPGHRALDEYELVGHYDHWREDIALAGQLGLKALRWGVPWYRVEPEPGRFDWSWTDQVIPYIVEELGIIPIIDLIHYGCPFWLSGSFANRDYPRAVASYAGAFARRYGRLVNWYTPCNEPIVTSMMCGRQGTWPPYFRGDSGYVRIMAQLAKGIIATVKELKSVQPDSIMVHVEAAGVTRAARPDLAPLAVEDQLTRFLCYDLITGRVDLDHQLYTWLVRNGTSPDTLASFVRNPIGIDVLGLNFYPQWSTRQVYIDQTGRLAYRKIERSGSGFAEMIADYHQRYGSPVMVTETSAAGTDKVRSRWLAAGVAAIKELRSRGVPVFGYTWFPLFTMYDWRYRTGRMPLERYRVQLGIFRLGKEDQPRWTGTPLAEQLKSYVDHPEEAIGYLSTTEDEIEALVEEIA